VIIVAAASAATFLPGQSSNITITPSNQTNTTQNLEQPYPIAITVKTDGDSATVHATSVPASINVSTKMTTEMKNRAYYDIKNYRSTVYSLKTDMKTIAKRYNFTANVTLVSQFGTDKLPFSATVSGTSMLPTLKNGQYIVALKTTKFKVGDIVISRHPTYGLIVKRVAAIKNGKVFLKSDNRTVETYNKETTLSDGIVEVSTITKTPLDTWQPVANVIAVVKDY
jgi:signal peptidase I